MAIRVSGINSGLDTDAIVQELVSAYSLKTEKYEKAQTKLTWKQDAWKSLNTKIYSLYTNVSNLRFSSAYSLRKVSVSDNSKATVTASSEAIAGTQKLNILQMAQSAYITGGQLGEDVTSETKLSDLGYTGDESTIEVKKKDGSTEEIKVTADTTVGNFVKSLKEAGLNASFDEKNRRLFVSAKDSGVESDFSLAGTDENAENVLKALGLDDDNAFKIDASDAVIELNGVSYTNSTNTFIINGLTINATSVTGAGDANAISITTSVDTQGIYDKIKDFLTEYNNVINEMTKLYNAESAGDYEPLTDEEKDAMSDTEIEKWETKIKDSLLRRDTSLNSVMSAMINSMAQAIEINGEKLSLSTFGITTMGYLNAAENEQYAYHIDGDEDDENTSGKKDKLMVAIEENPERIMEFMKKLTSNLYSAIDQKMKATELSSAYKVYNDKELDKELKNYASMISKWEDRVSEKEEYYYKKFSQMETALAKLNSQTSSISGLLGQ